MVVVIDVEPIRERFLTVAPFLDERGRRLVAAAEAFAAGYGGVAAGGVGAGVVPRTIGGGLEELGSGGTSPRARGAGGGRRAAVSHGTNRPHGAPNAGAPA